MAAPGQPVTGGGAIPLGYQQISATTLATAQKLTLPAGAKVALVSLDVGAVRWRDDGTAPTATVGMPFSSGSYITFTANLATIQFIAATGSPIMNVSFY